MSQLTPKERERLEDIIGDASWCADGDCGCHKAAHTARQILEGKENKEVLLEKVD